MTTIQHMSRENPPLMGSYNDPKNSRASSLAAEEEASLSLWVAISAVLHCKRRRLAGIANVVVSC
jgi:hypothetical protein